MSLCSGFLDNLCHVSTYDYYGHVKELYLVANMAVEPFTVDSEVNRFLGK